MNYFEKGQLFLEDLKDMTDSEVRKHLIEEYETTKEEVSKYDILIAYESEDSYEGNSFFLLKNKEDGGYYHTYGSHCSCYGFEGQFEPEKTTIKYLQSEHFSFYCGGYDDNSDYNQKMVHKYIMRLN